MGGKVEGDRRAIRSRGERDRVGQAAADRFGTQCGDLLRRGVRAGESADGVAFVYQSPRQLSADEPGAAGDEACFGHLARC